LQVNNMLINYEHKMKSLLNNKAKGRTLQPRDLVLRWDAKREDKGKHGNFNPSWFGPFKIVETNGNNAFLLENMEGEILELPVNGKFLKLYLQH